MGEMLSVPHALLVLGVVLLVYGVAPGFALAMIIRLMSKDDPRRQELQAELYVVPRRARPMWVAEQFEVAFREGLCPRVGWWFNRRVLHPATLDSGLERNRAHPESFGIPSDEDKQLLRPGDLVKLMWSVKRSQIAGERMWVEVTHRDGNDLVGVLDSWAVVAYLEPGEVVTFHMDNVIDLDFVDEEEAA